MSGSTLEERHDLVEPIAAPGGRLIQLGGGEGVGGLIPQDLIDQGPIRQGADHVVEGLLSGGRRGDPLDLSRQHRQHHGVELEPHHHRRGVVPLGPGQLGEVAPALLAAPAAEVPHLDPLDPQGGQHVGHVLPQGGGEDHEQGLAAVHLGVVVGQVGDAVQGHGGLAGPRRAADHHEARRRAGDQIELLGVDQARDVRQPLVPPPAVAREIGPQAPAGGRPHVVQPHRGPLPPRQARRLGSDQAPAVGGLGIEGEGALGRVDAVELSAVDGDGAAGRHLPDVDLATQLLLVLLPLLVGVEQPGDRCVTPVHDPDAAADPRGLAEEHVPAAGALVEAQVGEVGVVGVDLGTIAGLAHLVQQRVHPIELLHQGAEVLRLGRRHLLAEPKQLGDDVRL